VTSSDNLELGDKLKVAAIIPAHNEASTIGEVARIANECSYIDEVIVVDSLSTDDTAALAATAGARVLTAPAPGKGEAMAAGVAATDAEVLLFLDGDLLGLKVEHLDRLVRTVVKEGATMSCGLFDRGRFLNPIFLKFLPVLTGERALPRKLFESLEPDDMQGYKIEAALNSRCAEVGGKRVCFVCPGLWHVTKEKKFNPIEGFLRKTWMLAIAIWEYLAYRVRHRRRYRKLAVANARANAKP
jgi:glycosyltransferase involved in cell wall biosynthesis